MNNSITLENKTCTKCGICKPIDQYWRDQYYKDGVKSWCKECASTANVKWKREHPGKYKEYVKAWGEANKNKRRENKRAWDKKRASDPVFRLSNNIRTSMARALKGKKYFKKWETLIGYSLEDLIKHLSPKMTGEMTWDNYGSLWQVDHITPKSWFKYQAAEDTEFKKCWALENLQPKLKVDTIKKGNRYIG